VARITVGTSQRDSFACYGQIRAFHGRRVGMGCGRE
jgi:hypothetical protein